MGTWTHWVIWNIPAKATALPEGVAKSGQSREAGEIQGRNNFRRIGYGGPCPPPGKAHRYFFKLFALDTKLGLKAGSGRDALERAMNGHILSQTELHGHLRAMMAAFPDPWAWEQSQTSSSVRTLPARRVT